MVSAIIGVLVIVLLLQYINVFCAFMTGNIATKKSLAFWCIPAIPVFYFLFWMVPGYMKSMWETLE